MINPNWEMFRRRGAIEIVNEPERFTSNWLRIVEAPDFVRYYESSGPSTRTGFSVPSTALASALSF